MSSGDDGAGRAGEPPTSHVPAPRSPEAQDVAPLRLTLAINHYDHVRDLIDGSIVPQGIDLRCLTYPVEEIFWRFTRYREWDVSELSLAKYCSLRATGDDSLLAIPVFPSRIFRHSAVFVRSDTELEAPADLVGRRIGVPEWTQTATVYARGLLTHEYGVRLEDVDWYQGGVNEPGRVEGVGIELPSGVTCTSVRDRSLTEMLLAGDLDAIIAAHEPTAFKRRTGEIVRLVEDFRSVEERYWLERGVFPIMHVVALQRDVYERHRWVAMNLFSAFEEAKRRSLERILSANAPFFPLPWGFHYADEARRLFGADFWPYGVDANRRTIEAFLEFAHEQGVIARPMTIEELFVPETQTTYRI